MRCLPRSRCVLDEFPDRGGVSARVGALKLGDKLAGLVSAAGGSQELAQAVNCFNLLKLDGAISHFLLSH